MNEQEKYSSIMRIKAAIGEVVVAELQHPIILSRDYKVYLLSENVLEERRRRAIREELDRENARFNSQDQPFIEEYRRMGCEIETVIGGV